MRRILIVLFALGLGACASTRHGGYYDRGYGYGDYYHGGGAVIGYSGPGWYGPYDALFWNLRYSYFDPFWYPNFHYGVTFFPRYYYGWPFWNAGSYWRWRGYHPYSPHYGSWWDHYYHWQRPSGPRRALGPGVRGAGGNGPERYGSARNAAERMAQGRPGGDDWPPVRTRDPASGVAARQRAVSLDAGALPSSRYAPRSYPERTDGLQRSRADDRYRRGPERQQRTPALERGAGPAGDPTGAMRFRQAVPSRSQAAPMPPPATPWVEPSRSPTFRAAAPVPEPRALTRSEPASRAGPEPSSRGSMERSSPAPGRGASRSRGER
jgi:hypothetical protein